MALYYQLEEYISQHGIRIPSKYRDDYRAVLPLNQVHCDLRGQPHMGVVIPRITDGIHAFVDHAFDPERYPKQR